MLTLMRVGVGGHERKEEGKVCDGNTVAEVFGSASPPMSFLAGGAFYIVASSADCHLLLISLVSFEVLLRRVMCAMVHFVPDQDHVAPGGPPKSLRGGTKRVPLSATRQSPPYSLQPAPY